MENSEKLVELIEERRREGKIVFMTIEGLMSVPVRQIVNQPSEGLLYDLNRDLATSYTLLKSDEDLPAMRLVNDIAIANVVTYLLTGELGTDPVGRRGRMGAVPEDISKRAEEYQKEIAPPFDADDIISAYEKGAMDERKINEEDKK